MNASPADVGPSSYRPAPLFTLGSALGWLGHQCAQSCSTSIANFNADIWFTRLSQRPLWPTPQGTVVVVDEPVGSADDAEVAALVSAVDACTRADGIRVRRRHVVDVPATACPGALVDVPRDTSADPNSPPASLATPGADASTWMRIDRDGSSHWEWAAIGQSAPLTRIRPRARRP